MNKQQLASKIWESANKMRSKIEANEYKDYILGFMFYKFLSDKEVKWLKENDWTDEYLPDLTEDDAETLDTVRKNAEIKDLFVSAGIEEFSQIPADMAERKKFADLFQSFNENLEAAKVQGFEWDKPIVIINEDTDEKTELHADFDERTFKVLALRYKELFTPNPDGGENDPDDDVPYAVNSYLTTIDTADIDTDYMNSRFEKYLKIFYQEGAEAEAIHQAETELHKTFATLSQEEQKYANIFLHDIQSGAVVPQPGKTLREYIAEYIAQKQNDQIHKVAEVFGLDEKKLRAFMRANITEANINEFGRFDDLKATVDKAKAKAYFEAIEGTKLIPPKVPVKYDKLLREFIVSGGFDLKMPKES